MACVAMAFTACSEDVADDNRPTPAGDDGTVRVCLHIAAPFSGGYTPGTRADDGSTLTDDERKALAEGEDGEFMRSYLVLAIKKTSADQDDQDGEIVKVFQWSGETVDGQAVEKREDSLYTDFTFDTDGSSYVFYSFANLTAADIGLSSVPATNTSHDVTTSTTLASLGANFKSKAMAVAGNQTAVTGFGGKGIPMSNRQEVTISKTTGNIELQVVRMVAKMQLRLTNPTDNDIRINDIQLTDITDNPDAGKTNVMLLPGDKGTDGRRQPNFSMETNGATSQTLIYTPTEDASGITGTLSYTASSTTNTGAVEVDATGEYTSGITVPKDNGTKVITFYVNESQAQTTPTFLIRLNTQYDKQTNSKGNQRIWSRYDFLNWSAISRNEVHVLPIRLTPYRIGFTTEAYTAIGVLPTFDDNSSIYRIAFGMYGHYDILPYITDMQTGDRYYLTYKWDNDKKQRVKDKTMRATGTGTMPIEIESLQLKTADGSQTGQPLGQGGWDDNADHYPTVYWNPSSVRGRIEIEVGNYTGWATYTVNADLWEVGRNDAGDITSRKKEWIISRDIEFSNTAINFDDLAKRGWWRPSR